VDPDLTHFFHSNFFLIFLAIKTLNPDWYDIQPKMLDPDPDSMTPDPKHCLLNSKFSSFYFAQHIFFTRFRVGTPYSPGMKFINI
jgi:hypothetical protein